MRARDEGTNNDNDAWGKNEKFLKLSWKRPLKCKTCIFRNWIESQTSRQSKPPKKNYDKIWKNLSKCFSRLEGPPAWKSWREPRMFLSKPYDWIFLSRTSRQMSREKSKNPDFWKIFLSLFCNWDLDLPVSCKNLLCKLATGACDWLEAWGKSPEQGCTVFEIFENFQNKNTFQKQLKHFKIFCVWSTYNWAYATYLIKYNHTNE